MAPIVADRSLETTVTTSAVPLFSARWTAGTAFSGRRIQLGPEFKIPQLARPVQYPDVIVLIYGQPRRSLRASNGSAAV